MTENEIFYNSKKNQFEKIDELVQKVVIRGGTGIEEDIPSGVYDVWCVKCEPGQSKAGNPVIRFEMVICDGKYKGRRIKCSYLIKDAARLMCRFNVERVEDVKWKKATIRYTNGVYACVR